MARSSRILLLLGAWLWLVPAGALGQEPAETAPPKATEGEAAPEAESQPEAEASQAPSEAEADAADDGKAQRAAGEAIDARMDALMDRMVQARTRLAALGESLYDTRLAVTLDHRVKRFRVERLRLYLDGVPVFESDGRGLTRGDAAVLYSGFVAPGMHDVRIEIEQVSELDGSFGYTTQQRFRVRAKQDHRTEVRLRTDDRSDMAEEFEDDLDAEYDVRTRVRVLAEPLGES